MKPEIENKIKSRNVEINKDRTRVLVSVELEERQGREVTVRVTSSIVRRWLRDVHGLKAGVLISGNSIHNNMSRRLGTRTSSDLSEDFLFELLEEGNVGVKAPKVSKKAPVKKKPVVKAKPEPKQKPVVEAKPESDDSTKESLEKLGVEAKAKPAPKVKSTTRTTRAKSTRSRSTRTKKVDK